MSMKAVHNTGKTDRWIGGIMIPAGEIRHVPAHLVPNTASPAPAAAEPPAGGDEEAAAIQDLLQHSVKDLTEIVPALNDAELQALGVAEEARGPDARKGVLELVAKTKLERAAGDGKDDEGAAGDSEDDDDGGGEDSPA